MDADEIEALFTRENGDFSFARWTRPVAPIVFGVTDETLGVIKGALEAMMVLSGHKMAETDPELGSNFMMFFFRNWEELPEVPGFERLIPELPSLIERLKVADANQYRIFHFEPDGAIKACFVFLRMDAELSAVPAETLALNQITQSVLLWSDVAFRAQSPLVIAGDKTILRPDIAALIRAAYDPIMPPASQDKTHAMRLAARVGLAQ